MEVELAQQRNKENKGEGVNGRHMKKEKGGRM